MGREKDRIADVISKVVTKSKEPLETTEVQERVNEALGEGISRSKLVYRLNDLRGEGEISGKSIGSGKGVWIWWKRNQE